MLSSHRKEIYQNQPIDLIARLKQNEDLTRLKDENIRMMSAAIVAQLQLKHGDIVELEGKRYRIEWVKDSQGIKWLNPVKLIDLSCQKQL